MQEQSLDQKQIQKQMGCIGGFLQLFDRHQIHSRKSLPPATIKEIDATLESPMPESIIPVESRPKSPVPLPVLQFREGTTTSSRKFYNEESRLSLDSRATIDSKGRLKPKHNNNNNNNNNVEETNETTKHRSTSVIARLMGLDQPFPGSDPDRPQCPEFQRSASESRISKDLYHYQYRLVDGVNFPLKQSKPQQQRRSNNNAISSTSVKQQNQTAKVLRVSQRKKSFVDTSDFYPSRTVSICNEIEKRLKMRGIIEEPPKDLETLKQILEALQLKGLLHSSISKQRNFVFERRTFSRVDESPIIVIKPTTRSSSPIKRAGSVHSEIERKVNDQSKYKNSSSSSNKKTTPCTFEMERRTRNVPPVQSPKVGSRRTGSDQITRRSIANKKLTAEIDRKVSNSKVFIPVEDESSTVSESRSGIDIERYKTAQCKEGRNLLKRCDKLLHSIAEMTAATELQPSPVSVLDSSFYKEESSPSPVMKRGVDLKDRLSELEDEIWSPSTARFESRLEHSQEDCHFNYVSDILRASKYLPEESSLFVLLEKQEHLKGNDTSKESRLERKLIFDTIIEILNRKRQLPTWKAISLTGQTLLQQIWWEFQNIRQRDASDDLFEVICGVLKKDLSEDAINGWSDCPIEMAEYVLDIERLVFKDLIVEMIGDLASFKYNQISVLRRKLAF